MPTKTRLDPTAGGENPPAGQDGAQGSGHGDTSSSAGHPGTAPGDVSGFIDSLTALASHLKDRERLEAEARRAWGLRAVLALVLLVGQAFTGLFVLGFLASYSYLVSPAISVAIMVSGAATGFLAFVLYWSMFTRPLRFAPDSADRVALRHEDSPLRDRIRISQWILFDTALTRFAIAERSFKARQVGGVLATSGWAAVTLWLLLLVALFMRPSYYAGGSYQGAFDSGFLGALGLFLILTLATIMMTRREALADLGRAQSLARQVLAFDADFGGFLPKSERARIERFVAVGARGSAAESGS